ncbi:MAG: metal-dependent transcriptional regulator [Deltaproteobacteria bacterium]|nr:metal-dependent transcriptional regulator [Deltaproteobacteria bacterium]
MPTKVKVSPKMEDYLTTIHHLCEQEDVARVKSIAERLKVTNASVVGALKNLKGKGLVQQEHYGYVRLTEQGERIASAVIHRHEVLTHFFERILDLDSETAACDACKIEHSVSPETVRRISALGEFIRNRNEKELDWRREFSRFCGEFRGEQPK